MEAVIEIVDRFEIFTILAIIAAGWYFHLQGTHRLDNMEEIIMDKLEKFNTRLTSLEKEFIRFETREKTKEEFTTPGKK